MGRLLVTGTTPGALAAACRLAKVGHEVSVIGASNSEPGGHWRTDLPPVIVFPAVWRDLFTKSGRTLDAALATHRLEITAAPPTRHEFADGTALVLPADRGGQFRAIADAFGRPAADRWTSLCNDLDDLWQHLRMRGLERPAPHPWTAADRDAVDGRLTLGDLASRLAEPHLAQLVLTQGFRAGSLAGERAPALLASRIVVERLFGTWWLAGLDDREVRPGGVLIDALAERARQRTTLIEPNHATASRPDAGLADVDGSAPEAIITADPDLPRASGFWRRHTSQPAAAPTVLHNVPSHGDTTHLGETVRHTPSGPVITWTWRGPDGVRSLTHDHTQPIRDLDWGLDPASYAEWTRRPGLDRTATRTPSPHDSAAPTWQVSACSPGGNEPWAELLSGALVAYELHDRLTGLDIRPTNKVQPPPIGRTGRARRSRDT